MEILIQPIGKVEYEAVENQSIQILKNLSKI